MKGYFKIILVFSFFFLSGILSAQEMVVLNIKIIDLGKNQVIPDHYIHVKDGKIVGIFPEKNNINEKLDVTIIDGKGAYVLPGLAEMHAHIPTTDKGDFSYIQDVMWLYLANGVLNVRGMIGHPSHLELKKKIESGEITGPRIFAAGPSLNGETVKDPTHAVKMVREQKAAGYDHLKLHPGLDMPRFMAIAKTAQEVGIKYGGHVSLDVGLENALRYGYHSIEHMDGYIEALVADKSMLDPQVAGPFSMLLVEIADLDRIPELVQMTLKSGAWIAPTMSLFERFFGFVPADQFRTDPEMKYMPGLQVQQWVNQKKLLENQGLLTVENVQPYLALRKRLLKTLHENGVPVLMSSDSPQVFNVPGFSIHHEISSMKLAGISPVDILKTGSINTAKYFDKTGEFGHIKPDLSADFILVNGNPLEDLGHLKNIYGVMIRGEWIPQFKLKAELDRIEKKNERK